MAVRPLPTTSRRFCFGPVLVSFLAKGNGALVVSVLFGVIRLRVVVTRQLHRVLFIDRVAAMCPFGVRLAGIPMALAVRTDVAAMSRLRHLNETLGGLLARLSRYRRNRLTQACPAPHF